MIPHCFYDSGLSPGHSRWDGHVVECEVSLWCAALGSEGGGEWGVDCMLSPGLVTRPQLLLLDFTILGNVFGYLERPREIPGKLHEQSA
jgi:hypothetical protein